MNTLITAYYYNKDGYVSRFGWIENTDVVVFDEEYYELRKIKVCADCGEKLYNNAECKLCGSHEHEYITLEDEILDDDIVKGDPEVPGSEQIIAKQGTAIPYYKIRVIKLA